MPRREDEPVAIDPAWLIRVQMQRVPEEHRADFRASERQPEVAGLARFHRIHGETARLIGRAGENFDI